MYPVTLSFSYSILGTPSPSPLTLLLAPDLIKQHLPHLHDFFERNNIDLEMVAFQWCGAGRVEKERE